METIFKKLSFILTLTIISITAIASNRTDRALFDPGAPKSSKWPDLFAETPNYRLFGKRVIGGWGEKFRWNIGPMFYRGRLTPNSVKVFIVGQEGAQDENLSNRSFTGSTGTRMQKFLNYLGITKSYLFMNTFVYTITGQYSLYGDDAKDEQKKIENKKLKWLAQNPESIVVKHRHEMFDYMLETNKNSLSLIIGVGTAGKESVVTWLNSHSPGSCSYRKLTSSFCEGKNNLSGVKAIGLRHPGAASARNAGSSASGGLIADFKKKASIVVQWIKNEGKFLPKDNDGKRDFNKAFKYGYASIPHSDFSFGTPWTLGDKGTTSNRRGKASIQVYSKNGCYNNGSRINGRCQAIKPDESVLENKPDPRVHYLYFKNPKNFWNKSKRPTNFQEGDLPFEPPKSIELRREYDEGPAEYASLLINYFNSVKEHKDLFAQDLSFGHTGMYRGRFKKITLLILTDQFSYNDMFSNRALTGTVGQKLSPFLNNFGEENDYLILRTTPVNCLEEKVKCRELAQKPAVVRARKRIIKKVLADNDIKIIFTLGKSAKIIGNSYDAFGIPIIHLNKENINKDYLQEKFYLTMEKYMESNSLNRPSYQFNFSDEYIPRRDLPFMTRWWMGTSGESASQAKEKIVKEVRNFRIRSYDIGKDNGDYYKLYSPSWNNSWAVDSNSLTEKETLSLETFDLQFVQ